MRPRISCAPGYPRDAEALLIVELDGPGAEVEELIARVSTIAHDAGGRDIRISASEAERMKFWAGPQGGLSGRGPHLARLPVHGRHDPAQGAARGAEADGRSLPTRAACASPMSSTPATAICTR
jgi:hypothetical protein